jgi:serine/threonine-protein kinase RsbW
VTTPRPSDSKGRGGTWRVLAELSVPSEPGNERLAIEQVTEAVKELDLPQQRLEKLKTAVAEATMNAMEHGNAYLPEVPVTIRVLSSEADLSVRISDRGGSPVPDPDETPDLEAKLEGTQTPRGWGLFLIKNMVDEMHVTSDESHHTVELVMHLKGGNDAR